MLGSEKEKMELFQSHKILFRAHFKMATALTKRVLHLILLRDRQQRVRKQEKYKKHLNKKIFSGKTMEK
jgi:hypothetical protein